jgi:hypothetical protein
VGEGEGEGGREGVTLAGVQRGATLGKHPHQWTRMRMLLRFVRGCSDLDTSTGRAPHEGSRVRGADGSFVHLSQRFSSSRRESVSGLFSAHYMGRISLVQARHLSTLQSLDGLDETIGSSDWLIPLDGARALTTIRK